MARREEVCVPDTVPLFYGINRKNDEEETQGIQYGDGRNNKQALERSRRKEKGKRRKSDGRERGMKKEGNGARGIQTGGGEVPQLAATHEMD